MAREDLLVTSFGSFGAVYVKNIVEDTFGGFFPNQPVRDNSLYKLYKKCIFEKKEMIVNDSFLRC